MINLVGEKVKHTTRGEGEITGQNGSYIKVKYKSLNKEIKYLAPDCFKKALMLLNNNLLKELTDNNSQLSASKKTQEETVTDYSERHLMSENMIAIKDVELLNEEMPSYYYSTRIPSGAVKTVNDFCMKYIPAVNREITYLSKTGGKKYRVFDGKFIVKKNDRYNYIFETDDELHFPDETAIRIFCGSSQYDGKILYCEEFTITITTKADLGKNIPFMEFTAEPWFLLQKLNQRLNEMTLRPNSIVKQLVSCDETIINRKKHGCRTGADSAIEMSFTQPITFIWGPPGTGKTETLANMAIEHINKNEKVLMLSYSNVSVDGALLRVCKLLKQRHENIFPGKYLRYGYPRDEEILGNSDINAYDYTLSKHPEEVKRRNSLLAEKRKLSREDARYLEINKELALIGDKLKKEVVKSVKQAAFIATTVSKAFVDRAIFESSYDIVIFDEASMAYVPQIVFSASLARKHFVCIGDFSQLPPIVQSDRDSILNSDIFNFCKIPEALNQGYYHNWLCMLNIQYRMHPSLAEAVNHTMYHGLLHTGDGVEKERATIAENIPFHQSALGLIDLSGMLSVCIRTKDSSRINILSALISFATALELSVNCEVGIITPYHAQSKLLLAMERDAAKEKLLVHPISCATVHQFQGSEKESIIYDAVECYRMAYPGLLLTAMTGNYANRLFNVALTRAKGKFLTVANTEYFRRKRISQHLLFRKLLDRLQNTENYLTGEHYLGNYTVEDGFLNFYEPQAALKRYLKDIETSRTEIRMDLPHGVDDNDSLVEIVSALQIAKKNGVKVYIRAEDRDHVPSCIKSQCIMFPYAVNPITIIDKKIVWYNMPFTNAAFKTCDGNFSCDYSPLIRLKGRQTAKSIYGFLEMNRTVDQSSLSDISLLDGNADNFAQYVLQHKKCTVCGKPMCLKKGKSGKFFLSCTGYPDCKHIDYVREDFVENYFYRNNERGGQRCPQCNCSLSAKVGPFGLYVECGGEPPHRYKLDEI